MKSVKKKKKSKNIFILYTWHWPPLIPNFDKRVMGLLKKKQKFIKILNVNFNYDSFINKWDLILDILEKIDVNNNFINMKFVNLICEEIIDEIYTELRRLNRKELLIYKRFKKAKVFEKKYFTKLNNWFTEQRVNLVTNRQIFSHQYFTDTKLSLIGYENVMMNNIIFYVDNILKNKKMSDATHEKWIKKIQDSFFTSRELESKYESSLLYRRYIFNYTLKYFKYKYNLGVHINLFLNFKLNFIYNMDLIQLNFWKSVILTRLDRLLSIIKNFNFFKNFFLKKLMLQIKINNFLLALNKVFVTLNLLPYFKSFEDKFFFFICCVYVFKEVLVEFITFIFKIIKLFLLFLRKEFKLIFFYLGYFILLWKNYFC